MKKLILALLVLGASSVAFSGHGPSGCGLGTLIFADSNDVLWKQVLSSTSNGSSGNQTFGMTSGTSNCDMGGGMAKAVFIKANKVAISNDIARGNGNTLASLAKLYGCGNTRTFGVELQKNYESIFPQENVSANHIDASIQRLVTKTACI